MLKLTIKTILFIFILNSLTSSFAFASLSNSKDCARFLKMFFYGVPIQKNVFKRPEVKFILTNTKAGQALMANILEVQSRDVYSMPNITYRRFLHELDKAPQKKDIARRMTHISLIVKSLKKSKFNQDEINTSLEVMSDYLLRSADTKSENVYFKKMIFPTQNELNDIALFAKKSIVENEVKRSKLNKLMHEMSAHTKEAFTCLKRMPKSKVKSSALKLAIFQFFITEFFVISGYVTASDDFENIDWQNLSTDVGVYAITSVSEPWLALGGATSFLGKYLQLVALGTGKAGVDATIYYFNPLTDTHGRDLKEATVDRATYTTLWALGSAASKVGLYTTLIAMQCYVPNAFAMDIINAGSLISYRFANSYLYFKLRNNYMTDDSKK